MATRTKKQAEQYGRSRHKVFKTGKYRGKLMRKTPKSYRLWYLTWLRSGKSGVRNAKSLIDSIEDSLMPNDFRTNEVEDIHMDEPPLSFDHLKAMNPMLDPSQTFKGGPFKDVELEHVPAGYLCWFLRQGSAKTDFHRFIAGELISRW